MASFAHYGTKRLNISAECCATCRLVCFALKVSTLCVYTCIRVYVYIYIRKDCKYYSRVKQVSNAKGEKNKNDTENGEAECHNDRDKYRTVV